MRIGVLEFYVFLHFQNSDSCLRWTSKFWNYIILNFQNSDSCRRWGREFSMFMLFWIFRIPIPAVDGNKILDFYVILNFQNSDSSLRWGSEFWNCMLSRIFRIPILALGGTRNSYNVTLNFQNSDSCLRWGSKFWNFQNSDSCLRWGSWFLYSFLCLHLVPCRATRRRETAPGQEAAAKTSGHIHAKRMKSDVRCVRQRLLFWRVETQGHTHRSDFPSVARRFSPNPLAYGLQ